MINKQNAFRHMRKNDDLNKHTGIKVSPEKNHCYFGNGWFLGHPVYNKYSVTVSYHIVTNKNSQQFIQLFF